jgi:hypothetical protein
MAHQSVSADLGAYLAECAGRAFDWRAWNCCHFAGGWVRRRTGIDALTGLPATPSRYAARRACRSLGATLADAVDTRLGFAPTAAPREGDLVLVNGRSVGICAGPGVAVLTPESGLCFVPPSWGTRAWRVPA